MSNTMKTIIFIISLFTFLLFFILINFIIPTRVMEGIPNIVFVRAVFYISGYITALYTQALLKHLYVKSHIKNLNIIKIFPARFFEMRDRLIMLTLPIIGVLMPMVNRRAVSAENLWSLVCLAVLAVVIEVLFLINSKTLKIYVADKGIAIDGMDFRLELSVPFSYGNAAGWYPFERIESYLALKDSILLYHTYDLGTIILECSGDEVKQIKGLLISKGVQERRY